jgi:uncharacterized membrane protein YjjB (DUF3815 family)
MSASFKCIHCGSPTDSLYRVYSPSSIKLVQCSRCQANVDPYVEREDLLIWIDCILLRQTAYRHLLWNRLPYDWQTLLQTAGASVCVQALYLWSANITDDAGTKGRIQLWQLYVVSCIETIILVFVVSGLCCALYQYTDYPIERSALIADTAVNQSKQSSQLKQSAKTTSTVFTRAAMAVLLPSLFLTFVVFSQVWENTRTVQSWGVALVWIFRCCALQTVCVEGEMGLRWLNVMFVACAGWLSQVAIHTLLSYCTGGNLPCPGITMPMSAHYLSVCCAIS